MKTELYIPFKTICELTGNQSLITYLESVCENIEKPEKKIRLRYITGIADKGNKSRAVAISDY